MKQKSITISLPDQTQTGITLFEPEQKATKGVVLIFPAMGVRASYYKTMAGTMASDTEFSVITADLRGHGLSSVRASRQVNYGFKDLLHYDYEGVVQKTKELYPNLPLYLLGHSLGGQLSCLYMAKNSETFKGLILIAACSVYYKAWGKRKWHTLLGTQACRVLAQVVGHYPGEKVGFGGRESRGLVRDWSYQARTGNYVPASDDFDYEAAMKQLNIPTLVFSFKNDRYSPISAVTHLYQKLGSHSSGSLTHHHLHKARHQPNFVYGHFNWVKQPEEIIRLIKEWT